MVDDLQVLGTPEFGEEVLFFINMDKSGTLEIYLDLDDEPGFQTGGKDIALVSQIEAGGDIIVWDGRDGEGNYVDGDVMVIVTSRFSTGVTHLPIFDPEYHEDGFIVHRLLPDSMRAALYWDDSQLPDGTVEFEGTIEDGKGHNFPHVPGGYGDERTMNTWWNGYEVNNLKSFSFTLSDYLPIELINWKVYNKGEYTQFYWTTASEVNNHYFEIQHSCNGTTWSALSTIPGAGNSSTVIKYSEKHVTNTSNIHYFRLCQFDYDGTMECSKIISPQKTKKSNNIKVYNSNSYTELIIEDNTIIDCKDIHIYTAHGKLLTNSVSIKQTEQNKITLSIDELTAGAYILRYKNKSHFFYRK